MIRILAQVRANERRATLGAFLTLFGIMAGHAILETARDALFLAKLPPSRLPWVYLIVAILALALARIQDRTLGNRGDRQLLGWSLLGSAAVTALLWAWLKTGGTVAIYALYIWPSVYSSLVIVRFWILVGDVFTITQAKRLFAVIGTGSVLGAIAGSATARVLAEVAAPETMVLAAMALFGVTALGPMLLLQSRATGSAVSEDQPDTDWGSGLRIVLRRPYLKKLLALTLVSTLALTLVDYLFKSFVAAVIEPERLGSFFSSAYLGLNLMSLLVQITLVRFLTHSFGLQRVLAILPSGLGLAALALLAALLFEPFLVLPCALMMKVIDGSLRHSIHRTSTEMLFVPLTREARARAKTVIDVLGQRGGQALASMGILAGVALGNNLTVLTGVLAALLAAWIVVANRIFGLYLDLNRTTLEEGHFETSLDFPELDMASLETLIATLNRPNDAEVIAALDLLAQQGRSRLIPALILYHPSSDVVLKALDVFAHERREDILPVTERLMEHQNPAVRAASMRARAAIAPDISAHLHDFLEDPSPEVRSTALVGLAAARWVDEPQAKDALAAFARAATARERTALAEAIYHQPDAIFEDILLQLSSSVDLNTRVAVGRAMQAVANPKFIPPLIDMLSQADLRPNARAALLALGKPALDALEAALEDTETPTEIRRHIPRTIHRFDHESAVRILLPRLASDSDGMTRFKILRALGQMRDRRPDLRFDPAQVEAAIDRTMESAFRLIDWRQKMKEWGAADPTRRTDVHELMLHAFDNKFEYAIERLFRLVGLTHDDPGQDFQRIYQGIRSDRPDQQASSRELVEALIEPPLRNAILGILDDTSDREKLRHAGRYYRPRVDSYEELMGVLMQEGSVALSSLAAYHVGELKIKTLEPYVEEMSRGSSAPVVRTARRALDLLRGPMPEGAGG